MLTMGFTNVYYTLWDVDRPFERFNIYCSSKELVQPCTYMQNLSKDYDKAFAKLKERAAGSKYAIDLELKGEHSFDRILSSEKVDMYEQWQFSFGKLAGQDIRICDDIWQLNRAMTEEKGMRRRVFARRRLMELGELMLNTFGSDFGDDKYISTSHYRRVKEKIDEQKMSGHFFENGKRITISVKELRRFGYETQWGFTIIQLLQLQDGKIVKYKGGNPIQFNNGEFLTLKATVEHGDYKGQLETRIKRPKLAS
jgi:hypothetical protein